MKPPDARRSLGRRGEDMAAAYLRERGLEIVTTNWRPTGSVSAREVRGELDIIARDGECLAFVEVRTRRAAPGLAEESVNRSKADQLLRLARAYLQAHEIREDEIEWRFDIVAISLTSAGAQINWIPHALYW